MQNLSVILVLSSIAKNDVFDCFLPGIASFLVCFFFLFFVLFVFH